jgi:hypothetical protein
MDYNSFKKEVHNLAVEKGWYDTERSEKELVLLIKSELFEALEEYRKDNMETYYVMALKDANINDHYKPCGFYVELADMAIRALDMAGFYGVDIEQGGGVICCYSQNMIDWFDEMDDLLSSHKLLTKSEFISQLLIDLRYFCSRNGKYLDELILEKHEYNKTRPKRHGGKKI